MYDATKMKKLSNHSPFWLTVWSIKKFSIPLTDRSVNIKMIETLDTIRAEELNNIRVSETETGFVIALIDEHEFEIVRGFGDTITEALNDMHRNLI
jgi:hypothetical protein